MEAPSPSPSSEADVDWTFFSGTVDFSEASDFDAGGGASSEHGVAISRGIGSRGHTMVTDDPRMNGTRTDILDLYSSTANNSSANLGMALVMIENDEGAWTCPMTYMHQATPNSAAGEIEQWAGWCEGSGAYQGLRAYLAMRQPEDPGSSKRQDVYGIVTSGDGPTMPEAPAS